MAAPQAAAALRRPGAAGRAGPGAGGRARPCCCSTSRWPRWTPVPGWTPGPSCTGIWPRDPGATLLVTHDPLDALVLADRLVIIEDGRVVQEGDAATITGAAAHRLRGPAGRPEPVPGHGRRARRHARPTAAPSRSPTRWTVTCSWRSRRPRSPCTRAARTAARATPGRRPSPASSATATTCGCSSTGRSRRRRRHPGRRRPAPPRPRSAGLGRGQGHRDPRLPGLSRKRHGLATSLGPVKRTRPRRRISGEAADLGFALSTAVAVVAQACRDVTIALRVAKGMPRSRIYDHRRSPETSDDLHGWKVIGVARGGVEPPTFRFSVGRSYQLSYLARLAHVTRRAACAAWGIRM